MDELHNSINQEYQKGYEYKEEARKSTNQLDKYKLAAQHLDKAAELCKRIVDDNAALVDDRIQSEVFYNYYLSEKYSCLSSYFYEMRLTDDANTNQNNSIEFIKTALNVINAKSSNCNSKTRDYLNTFIDKWTYILKAKEAQKLAPDARKYWDEGKLVEALDYYRRMMALQKEAIELAKKVTIEPVYERIAIGNYIGMMANMSSTLARVFLSRANDSTPKQISQDDAIELVSHTLEAARFGRIAFNNNPEWRQYLDGAKLMEQNVVNFLNDNAQFWMPMIIHFENQPEVLSFMKKVSIKKYKEAEAKIYFSENKIGKLWSLGSFWLISLIIISFIVVFIAERSYPWWEMLVIFIVIETLLLIVGAFILRTAGDLSEERFIELIKFALTHQFRQFKNIFKKSKS